MRSSLVVGGDRGGSLDAPAPLDAAALGRSGAGVGMGAGAAYTSPAGKAGGGQGQGLSPSQMPTYDLAASRALVDRHMASLQKHLETVN